MNRMKKSNKSKKSLKRTRKRATITLFLAKTMTAIITLALLQRPITPKQILQEDPESTPTNTTNPSFKPYILPKNSKSENCKALFGCKLSCPDEYYLKIVEPNTLGGLNASIICVHSLTNCLESQDSKNCKKCQKGFNIESRPGRGITYCKLENRIQEYSYYLAFVLLIGFVGYLAFDAVYSCVQKKEKKDKISRNKIMDKKHRRQMELAKSADLPISKSKSDNCLTMNLGGRVSGYQVINKIGPQVERERLEESKRVDLVRFNSGSPVRRSKKGKFQFRKESKNFGRFSNLINVNDS